MEIRPLKNYDRIITAPADKSITHRAVMFSALGYGSARVHNALLADDCMSTIACMRRLGANIEAGEVIKINGGIKSGNVAGLFVGNSGTTMRLLTGALCGRDINVEIDGDLSIRRRPMKRIIDPLTEMGAHIESASRGTAPLRIEGAKLRGITYRMPVASAQVKSAVLLAGLTAEGETTVIENVISRDHTERMLRGMGANIRVDGSAVTVGTSILKCTDVYVPGDISGAAFALCLAAGMKGGHVTVQNVGVNPTRTGILDVLKSAGAAFEVKNLREDIEPYADIELEYTALKPFELDGAIMPRLIDEVPVLAALAAFIEGRSVIRGAEELKVKESNRIDVVVDALKRMGADVTATADGMIINGRGRLQGGAEIDCVGDHRIAMAMAVAGALSEDGVKLIGHECASVSYPDFYKEVLGIGND